ncbi:hypothetical protein CCP3SC15_10039 [Gammaproteobacteria bacterium]
MKTGYTDKSFEFADPSLAERKNDTVQIDDLAGRYVNKYAECKADHVKRQIARTKENDCVRCPVDAQ